MNDKYERQMKKGVLDMLVLKLLEEEPKYGYQLITEMKEKMDYKNVGGALLGGVNGVVIKAHGSCDVKCFLSALDNAHRLVVHKIVESKDELCVLQGSKYLQCKADNETFKYIRKELKNGRKVLYSGMACQVEGLKSFLRKDYDNLYTIDLICMGIPSYVVWQKYLAAFFGGEKIKSINFKEKSIGWDTFTFRVDTDKRIFKERGMHNLYLRSMFLSWNMRPSCFQCPFKNAKRISDFTLADAWGVSHSTPEINDNKGLSSVVVHSKKGLELWNILNGKIDSVQVSIDDIAAGNSNLITNKPQTGDRKLFFETLNVNSKEAFLNLCSIRKAPLKQRIKNKLIAMLSRFGA